MNPETQFTSSTSKGSGIHTIWLRIVDDVRTIFEKQNGYIYIIDLLINYFRHEISRFRARVRKNYEAYTAYMLNNFSEVGAEIWESQ